ncbi:MAG: hypothetical protein E2P02_11080 [Acidobacteria bacterium]|nr:MAG: hypothetical protein E2P02_11080 [Acidobacteriota bacterium]
MKHLDEEELVLYHYGDAEDATSVEEHLKTCARCRAELAELTAVLADVSALPAPDRGDEYGEEVWAAIAHKLTPRRRVRSVFMLAAAAVLLAGTFLVGRLSTRWNAPPPSAQIRERILLVALDEHLDRSQMLLLELVNAPESTFELSAARELLHESRLYRQTAFRMGDLATTDVLDEIERLLLDVVHGTTSGDVLTARIVEQDVFFKIRILQTNVRRREEELKSQQF